METPIPKTFRNYEYENPALKKVTDAIGVAHSLKQDVKNIMKMLEEIKTELIIIKNKFKD